MYNCSINWHWNETICKRINKRWKSDKYIIWRHFHYNSICRLVILLISFTEILSRNCTFFVDITTTTFFRVCYKTRACKTCILTIHYRGRNSIWIYQTKAGNYCGYAFSQYFIYVKYVKYVKSAILLKKKEFGRPEKLLLY